jgi:hypothetical protein
MLLFLLNFFCPGGVRAPPLTGFESSLELIEDSEEEEDFSSSSSSEADLLESPVSGSIAPSSEEAELP